MNEQQYQAVLNYIRKNKTRESIMAFLCLYSPVFDIVLYILLTLNLIICKSYKLVPFLVIPGLCLICTSLLRKKLNQPRPNEVFDIVPLIAHSKSASYPSRHTASAFIISYACFYISLPLGILTFLIAIYVGISRVIAGVHFMKDIICGFVVASVFGILFLLV